MFNSWDPSPFWDRDLDPAAAEYIESEFAEKPLAGPWVLLVEVREGDSSSADLQTALKSHYQRQAMSAGRALREHLWVGQFALIGGCFVFLLSLAGRALLRHSSSGLAPWIEEGLIVLAWLALWRPAEALLYDWIPHFRRRRRYRRLAQMRVAVQLSPKAAVLISRPGDSDTVGTASGRKSLTPDHTRAAGIRDP